MEQRGGERRLQRWSGFGHWDGHQERGVLLVELLQRMRVLPVMLERHTLLEQQGSGRMQGLPCKPKKLKINFHCCPLIELSILLSYGNIEKGTSHSDCWSSV